MARGRACSGNSLQRLCVNLHHEEKVDLLNVNEVDHIQDEEVILVSAIIKFLFHVFHQEQDLDLLKNYFVNMVVLEI